MFTMIWSLWRYIQCDARGRDTTVKEKSERRRDRTV
jgi:hypothetical protein